METDSKTAKNVLVAPLNWGLGHATRCIPIIKALEEDGFNPILASDGVALELLRKEFPHLKTLQLPSYGISYPRSGKLLKLRLLFSAYRIMSAVKAERKLVTQWVDEYQLVGIISDNRFGIRSGRVPSVYMTHQLRVFSGLTTFLTTAAHQKIIAKYNQCWIPDSSVTFTLSGKLGHVKKKIQNIKYIGALSRFKKSELPLRYDLMILLSGPEPQREILEKKLLSELKNYSGNIIFVAGKIEAMQKIRKEINLTYFNFMVGEELEKSLNESKLVVCRSGYTTIMDLAKLKKKAFFIPTPGQSEQEYLAKKLSDDGIVAFSTQKNFRLEDIDRAEKLSGFKNFTDSTLGLTDLFSLFKRK